jgi:hypothetical protein
VIAPLLALALISAPPTPTQAERTATLSDALDAFDALSAEDVDRVAAALDDAAHGRCLSSLASLRVPCLQSELDERCGEEDACRRVGDVLITLKLAESTFVKTSERHRVLREAAVFRVGLRQATTRAHARLLTGLVPRARHCAEADRRCLATAIDAFCVDHAQQRGLSWHRCAAASVAFIGRRRP